VAAGAVSIMDQNQTEKNHEEYIEYNGVKFKVAANIGVHKLELFDSYTERPKSEQEQDIELEGDKLSAFAQAMLIYADTYKNWGRGRQRSLYSYNKDELIETRQDVAVTAKCYFNEKGQKLIRSLKNYGVDISRRYNGDSLYCELYEEISLATNVLHSLISDFPEEKIQEFLYTLVTVSEGLYQRCQEVKSNYLNGAMSQFDNYKNNV
jgi:hypothetical protein